jgi:tetratricopeptide (TPR) repeat protein
MKHHIKKFQNQTMKLFIIGCIVAFISLASTVYSQQTQAPEDKKEHIAHRAGDKKMKAGDPAGALVEYTKAVQANSKYAPGFASRGIAYLAQSKFEDAVKDFNKVEELKSNEIMNDPRFLYNFGSALVRTNNQQGALEKYTRAITQINGKPDSDHKNLLTDIYTNRGQIFLSTEQYEMAIANFDSAISTNQRVEMPYFYSGNAYYSLASKMIAIEDTKAKGVEYAKKSIDSYTSAISSNSKNYFAFNNRGMAKIISNVDHNIEVNKSAVEDFKSAISIKGNERDFYLNAAFALEDIVYRIDDEYLRKSFKSDMIGYYKKAADMGSDVAKDWLKANNSN